MEIGQFMRSSQRVVLSETEMSDSSKEKEEVFLTLRQSSFEGSFGPSTPIDSYVSRATSHIANQDVWS